VKYLTWLITIPLTIFTVLFAVSNPAEVAVGIWPLEATKKIPAWLLGLGMGGVGFFLGALFVWILAQRTHFRYWQEQRRATRLEKELEALQAKHAGQKTDTVKTENVTALPAPPNVPAPVRANLR
jgi:hypothetical protein